MIGDDNIKDLIEILPQIIIYIVIGYTFNKTYHLVALKQNSTDIDHILTSSLVIGVIYYKIVNLIPIHVSNDIDNIMIIISSLISAYLLARIFTSKYWISIFDLLKIRDTGNTYYWDDLMDNNYPMKIKVTYDNFLYEGMLHNFQSYSNEPHIVLASYIVKNEYGDILDDFTNNDTKLIVLDTAKANNVEIIYANKSEICKDLNNLCNSNATLYNIKEEE